jgi:hypothetical protein
MYGGGAYLRDSTVFHVLIIIGVAQGQLLDQVIDGGHGGVSTHLGQIADRMDEWEGAVAENLGLHPADVAEIKEAHSGKLKLQA